MLQLSIELLKIVMCINYKCMWLNVKHLQTGNIAVMLQHKTLPVWNLRRSGLWRREVPQSGIKTIFKSGFSKKNLYVKGNNLRVSKRSPL